MKKTLALLAALCVGVAVSGCGTKSADDEQPKVTGKVPVEKATAPPPGGIEGGSAAPTGGANTQPGGDGR